MLDIVHEAAAYRLGKACAAKESAAKLKPTSDATCRVMLHAYCGPPMQRPLHVPSTPKSLGVKHYAATNTPNYNTRAKQEQTHIEHKRKRPTHNNIQHNLNKLNQNRNKNKHEHKKQKKTKNKQKKNSEQKKRKCA